MRLLPHDQNTGGFYVCVLEKAGSASTSTSAGTKRGLSPSAEDRDAKKEKLYSDVFADPNSAPASGAATPIPSAAEIENGGRKKKQDWSYREDPFAYAPQDDTELESIHKYFKLKDSFPKETILVRNEEGKVVRVAYFTNQLVKVSRPDASFLVARRRYAS